MNDIEDYGYYTKAAYQTTMEDVEYEYYTSQTEQYLKMWG